MTENGMNENAARMIMIFHCPQYRFFFFELSKKVRKWEVKTGKKREREREREIRVRKCEPWD